MLAAAHYLIIIHYFSIDCRRNISRIIFHFSAQELPVGVAGAQLGVEARARDSILSFGGDLVKRLLWSLFWRHLAILAVIRYSINLVILQVAIVLLASEGGPHLLHRTHLLHLIDDFLLPKEVEVPYYKGAEGQCISLKLLLV